MPSRPRWRVFPRSKLTKREVEVLILAAQGLSIRETAQRLFISSEGVKSRRALLFLRLEAKNITHAVAIGYEKGLLGSREGAT